MVPLPSSFAHVFEPPGDKPGRAPLLLLHGTGGDEHDLLPLGRAIAPGAALLSPRGRVLEGNLYRFFRREAEGVFDQDDVRRRAGELARFVEDARAAYGLAAPIAVGVSNGANIAAAVLLLHPDVLAGAILLRAMVPLDEPPPAELDGKPVLMLSGQHDSLITPVQAADLAALLTAMGAAVDHRTLDSGHRLTQADADEARTWLERNVSAGPG